MPAPPQVRITHKLQLLQHTGHHLLSTNVHIDCGDIIIFLFTIIVIVLLALQIQEATPCAQADVLHNVYDISFINIKPIHMHKEAHSHT